MGGVVGWWVVAQVLLVLTLGLLTFVFGLGLENFPENNDETLIHCTFLFVIHGSQVQFKV